MTTTLRETNRLKQYLDTKTTIARLILEDGTVFEGRSFGAENSVPGEVIFNTAMVGYPEAMTDPSYHGQIMVFTSPMIGNYGVPAYSRDEFGLPAGFESEKIQAAGVIVTEYTPEYSHFDARRSLGEWLQSEGIPGITDIDTRALTKRLRAKGTMLGKIEFEGDHIEIRDPLASCPAPKVSPSEVVTINARADTNGKRRPKVVVVDCGCKANIKRSLLKRGVDVIVVPYDHYFLNIECDGIVLSNGPGDPEQFRRTTRNVEHALALGIPTLGICLGHQLLSLAAGFETYKLKFGHRSQNQPCLEQGGKKRCIITSQNHGFAVRQDNAPSDWDIWFINANDGSVEGVRHKSKPFRGVQFHPEATPGPVDSDWIFDEFVTTVKQAMR